MKYLFFVSISIIFAGCSGDFFSQVVEIDPPEYTKSLTFHLNLQGDDSIARVVLSRNFGILETVNHYDDWFVKGASMEMLENGQHWFSFDSLSADSAYVMVAKIPHPFLAGNSYEIRAYHPDFQTVTAVQTMPGEVQVDSAHVKRGGNSQPDVLDVYIHDTPKVKNYYEVQILSNHYEVVNNPNGSIDTIQTETFPFYVDSYSDPNISNGFRSGGLISDQFFDGQSYKFQARFYGNYSDSTILVKVRNVTEDYYRWSTSYYKHNEIDNPLSEPVSIFNNLINGLGIFSLSSEKTLIARYD